jgi:CheY-like chemotaxis protein
MFGKVLVVEDDDSVRRLLVEYLQGRPDLAVDSARDGVEALHQIAITRYDVVVLDLMMPMMSGVDFLDSLKALTSDPSVKSLQKPPAVIVITAASDSAVPRDMIVQRYPQVIRAILRKPFDFERLGAEVEKELR